jgi:hypothetical protein
MKALFVELPPFERHRQNYLSDEEFRELQLFFLTNPLSGDVIEGTGGLRKLRYFDKKRSKGKRSGIRIIYYWWVSGKQFWLFTLYSKGEITDLTVDQRNILSNLLKQELTARGKP